MFEEKQKGRATERLSLARQFLSVDTAVERLAKWKTPEELLVINNNRLYLDFE